jgi:hypothetical protein
MSLSIFLLIGCSTSSFLFEFSTRVIETNKYTARGFNFPIAQENEATLFWMLSFSCKFYLMNQVLKLMQRM